MLVRVLVQNLFSFKEATEFNLLPGRVQRFKHHVKEMGGLEVLKLNAIYGANGAGKSNMIRTLKLLQQFLETGKMPVEFITQTFRFDKLSKSKDVYIGIEFITDDIPYYYGITINQGIIVEEELNISGVGIRNDVNLFLRTDNANTAQLSVEFFKNLLKDPEAALFPKFLQNEILQRNVPVLHHMQKRQHEVFQSYKKAVTWFLEDLIILLPHEREENASYFLDKSNKLRHFTNETIATLGTGLKEITIETISVDEFFGRDDFSNAESVKAQLKAKPDQAIYPSKSHEYMALMENGVPVVKRFCFHHSEDDGECIFYSSEESDGTIRLVDYMVALYCVIYTNSTYLIDEIERSIHPVLIKEIIKKFSETEGTTGQLIFSTHESTLLDQEIFRPDEIWFAEKKKTGDTHLYPLSDFKEHHTLDIRKGYLNGRYGAIPFLGNLKDLNWSADAKAE